MSTHGKTSLCIEINCIKGDELWRIGPNILSNKIIEQLIDMNLFNKDEIGDVFVHREENAYPIYNLDYKDNLKTIMEYIGNTDNIMSIGRQGLFKYNNMGHSIEIGMKAADCLLRKTNKKHINNKV